MHPSPDGPSPGHKSTSPPDWPLSPDARYRGYARPVQRNRGSRSEPHRRSAACRCRQCPGRSPSGVKAASRNRSIYRIAYGWRTERYSGARHWRPDGASETRRHCCRRGQTQRETEWRGCSSFSYHNPKKKKGVVSHALVLFFISSRPGSNSSYRGAARCSDQTGDRCQQNIFRIGLFSPLMVTALEATVYAPGRGTAAARNPPAPAADRAFSISIIGTRPEPAVRSQLR